MHRSAYRLNCTDGVSWAKGAAKRETKKGQRRGAENAETRGETRKKKDI